MIEKGDSLMKHEEMKPEASSAKRALPIPGTQILPSNRERSLYWTRLRLSVVILFTSNSCNSKIEEICSFDCIKNEMFIKWRFVLNILIADKSVYWIFNSINIVRFVWTNTRRSNGIRYITYVIFFRPSDCWLLN